MLQIEDYQSEVSRILSAQNKVLAGYSDDYGSNDLLEVGRYALRARGKVMRGMLLLEAYQAVGGDMDQPLFAAAGIEYGHLASLIHDDLIDHDELRRGQSTIWKAYDEEAAILSGDMFIFSAFHSLSLCRHSLPGERVARAFEVLSLACVELCLGQANEAQLSGKCTTDPRNYIEMIRQKTSSLIRASVETGAVLGGGSEVQIRALREYGDSLGIAFQIIDDLLPYTCQEVSTLKPVKSDVKNRRMTLPVIYALQKASQQDGETLRAIFEHGYLADAPDKALKTVMRIFQRTGALENARNEALRYQQNALSQLEHLPLNSGRTYLADLAELVIQRTY
jgi:geranylgeranyl pyrophosphate synthase